MNKSSKLFEGWVEHLWREVRVGHIVPASAKLYQGYVFDMLENMEDPTTASQEEIISAVRAKGPGKGAVISLRTTAIKKFYGYLCVVARVIDRDPTVGIKTVRRGIKPREGEE